MGVALRTGGFFGAVTRRIDTPAAVVSEVEHAAPRTLPSHRHEASYFCLLVRGAYVEEIAHRRLEYRPFSVGFHSPQMTHRDRIGTDGATFFSVELKPHWVDRALSEFFPRPEWEPRFVDGDLCALMARLYALHAEEVLDPETVDAALWELVGCLARERQLIERGRPHWFDACIDLVHADFGRPLTVLEVASTVGVHPVHLSREFRRRTGQTLGEYLHKLRVRAACAQLLDPGRSLADIALAAGFADQSHFCRVFKQLVGCSPGRFRHRAASR